MTARSQLSHRARLSAFASAFLASGGVLAACSTPVPSEPPGVAGGPTVSGTALSVEGSEVDLLRAWSAGDALVITTLGSGSCPTVPRIHEIDDGGRTVTVMTSIPRREGPCTADQAPRTFEFDVGRDVTGYSVLVTSPPQ